MLGRSNNIVEASGLDEARKLLSGMVPSLVLLDIRLKGEGRGGRGQYASLDGRSCHRVTAHALNNDVARILAAGCDACVSKPIDTQVRDFAMEHQFEQALLRTTRRKTSSCCASF